MKYFLPLSTILAVFAGCAHSPQTRHWALRLHPHQDLRQELEKFVRENHLAAAAIVTCVGSLEELNLRFADQKNPTRIVGRHEITSLVGTLSESGGSHLHLQVADHTGKSVGGHLAEGNKIYTTAEIVLVELRELEFAREPDPETTYKELNIRRR